MSRIVAARNTSHWNEPVLNREASYIPLPIYAATRGVYVDERSVIVSVKLPRWLVKLLDLAVAEHGYTSRSSLIREAVMEKLAQLMVIAGGRAPPLPGVAVHE